MTFVKRDSIYKYYQGLNIEGNRPLDIIHSKCIWYNLVMVIDTPFNGDTFEKVMEKVKNNDYKLIEEAIIEDTNKMINDITIIINQLKEKHTKVLVHIHQAENTTILHKILQEKTGVECISDKNNFYNDSPEYAEDIDALFSISQCAGFGLIPGTWIIPISYTYFDIETDIVFENNNVCFSNMLYTLDTSHIYTVSSKMLVCNSIWNPPNDYEGFMVFGELEEKILSYVEKCTKNFDKSHGVEHAIQVAKNVSIISVHPSAIHLALLHDVCDHKYSESISRIELKTWIVKNVPYGKEIDEMIDQISFSKQKNINRVHILVTLVRDADRLEALGKTGIDRCIEYTKKIGGKIPEDVIKHCYDKLLRLVPEGYIVSTLAQLRAIPLHNEIVSYVREVLPCTGLDYKIPEYL